MTYIDPILRGQAAKLLLDAVSSADLADAGTQAADDRMLLALAPTGLDVDDPNVAAFAAVSIELMYFFLGREATNAGVPIHEVISNMREHVLPRVYPEVH
jgi:hypothetical protein